MSIHAEYLGAEIDFQRATQLQEERRIAVLEGNKPETIFYLEHAPIYTIGRTRDRSSLGEADTLPHPSVEINRGGQATYHGPGQLVGYPILDLRRRGKDLHLHMRLIEETLIAACQDFGLAAQQRDQLTGVWSNHRKIASIGVGVRKWISMHGFAINITAQSLTGFHHITPCGLDGVEVTSLASELGRTISVEDFTSCYHQHFCRAFSLSE